MNRKTLSILITAALYLPINLAMADNTSSLTPEQQRHESQLVELRQQKELLELKHAQASLLKECLEMGIDCRGSGLNELPSPIEAIAPIDVVPMDIEQLSSLEPMDFLDKALMSSTSGSNAVPVLDAIQNQSAQLTHAGQTEWALVGDVVGSWRVTYIDATRVRLTNTSDSSVKTLVLRW